MLWMIGLVFYEVAFKKQAFKTHLAAKVGLHLIKKYPLSFPRGVRDQETDLKELIEQLTEKEYNDRIGSERFETEVLEHSFF